MDKIEDDIKYNKETKRLKKSKIKLSARESYWQLFARFCIVENESHTFTEIIDRVNFYNKNQKFLKKIPISANPANSCLLVAARIAFFGDPEEKPQTQYDYLYYLVENLSNFENWMQDTFKFYYNDSSVDTIIALLKPCIPKRFGQLNPDGNYVEEQGMLALSLVNYSHNDIFLHALEVLDNFRGKDPQSFTKLHCFLNYDFLPTFSVEDIKDKTTLECLEYVNRKKEEGYYNFTWRGKDIAKMRSEVPERACLRPDVENSKDFDTTQNLYLEGDNLRVLKLLLPSYSGKIKMIYIDPPYNTGSTGFCYKDKFIEETEIFERWLLKPFPKIQEE